MRSMDTKNFDNIVKTMMEGAQEEVSSRVWTGVQNGLKAAEARHTRIVFFRRAGYVLATAAAAVALLLTIGPKTDNSIQPTISEKAIALLPEKPVTEVQPQDSGRERLQTVPEEPAKPANVTVTRKASGKTAVVVKAETVVEETAVAEATPVVEETTVATGTIVSTETTVAAETVAEAKPEVVKDFVQLMHEDYIASRKSSGNHVRLYASGNTGSNGIRKTGFAPSIRRAQQALPPKNVIRENGESSYRLPVSFGLGLNIPLPGNFSIGTGVNYSRLVRTFSGKYLYAPDSSTDPELLYGDARHTLVYLGIPVNIYYSLPTVGHFKFYTFAGGEVERSFYNKYKITTTKGVFKNTGKNSGLQFSFDAGVGAEFKFTDHLGLYIDPSIKYYFDCDQPKSIRTQHQWMFSIEAGLRFDL